MGDFIANQTPHLSTEPFVKWIAHEQDATNISFVLMVEEPYAVFPETSVNRMSKGRFCYF